MPFPNQTTKWIRTQQRTWDQLHPHQQHLMGTIGIHGPTPLCRYNSHPTNPTSQPNKLTNSQTTTPKRENGRSQPTRAQVHKQHQPARPHTTDRQPQPAN